uniref:Uncharacterized protein n=1 Tax=Octopus bimaculoides TaxID=37653 RepID=A0A0L8HAG6_OCTBM
MHFQKFQFFTFTDHFYIFFFFCILHDIWGKRKTTIIKLHAIYTGNIKIQINYNISDIAKAVSCQNH